MNTKRWESVKDLLHQAMQLTAEERGKFLDEACASDATMRAELHSLLAAEEELNPSFLRESPAGALIGASGPVIAPEAGQVVSQRFQLIRKLGEGGMGQVWLAEQTAPVRRQVALKLIKAGMYDESVVQRFQSERQSLAIMDHPAIAKVFDAGTTEQGQPFFVMEYVPGLPIHEYCDQKKLTIKQRLELFRQACEGVQHAHQKAIIHRDLKPANILVVEVDGKPVPRIIDFGLAKAVTQGYGESRFTMMGSFVGTPGYMSPEQADPAGTDIDTRTDVYSLGVILYVLLTGVLPLETRQHQPLVEVLQELRDEEPERPSNRVSGGDRVSAASAAEARSTEVAQLASLLRGDLDWIAMKALEKDRSRRYGTPSELAADVERYLNHEPVTARPASAGYRVRKYVRRHRAGVTVAAFLLLLLTGFAVLEAVQLRRITRERDRANRERDRATRITDFTTNMFRVSDPGQARGNSVTAREILDKASNDIDSQLSQDPELQAQLMDVMGNVYENLGLHARAESLFERAVETQKKALGATNPETLLSATLLAKTLRQLGRYPEAEKLERETLDTERRVLGPEDPRTLLAMTQLGWTLLREGHYADAASLDQQALEAEQRVLSPENPQILSTMNDLASILRTQGDYAKAEEMDRQTLATRQRVMGTDHPQTLDSMTQLASDLYAGGLYSEAEKVDRQSMEIGQRVFGVENPYTLGATQNLSNDLASEGFYAEAEKLAKQTVEIETRVQGPRHPETVDAIDNLAQIERAEGHYHDAELLDRHNVEIRAVTLGPNHPRTLSSMAGLASDLDAQGSYAAAEKVERKALETQQKVLGPDNPELLATENGLAMILTHEGKYAEGQNLARTVEETDRRVFGPEKPETATSDYTLACIAALTDKHEEALTLLSQAVDHGLAVNLDLGLGTASEFKSLQGDARFDKIVEDAKQRVAALRKAK